MDDAAEGYLNDHSRAIYLMAPDNKFLAFYPLDLDENELATQVIEDISYDIGVRFIGTGDRPEAYQRAHGQIAEMEVPDPKAEKKDPQPKRLG